MTEHEKIYKKELSEVFQYFFNILSVAGGQSWLHTYGPYHLGKPDLEYLWNDGQEKCKRQNFESNP